MVIEFLLNEIKDNTKLYKLETHEEVSPFADMPELVERVVYQGKDYCKLAMDSAICNLTGVISYKYIGTLDRIANETFEITTGTCKYIVTCTIDTYQNKHTRMRIQISSSVIVTQEENEEMRRSTVLPLENKTVFQYDHFLEKLKLEVKRAFRGDWNSCVWIRDEQSETLCSFLYPCIFRAENRVRAFANKVLIWELGTGWISSPGLEKYAESHQTLSEVFRSKEPSFADVDDVFISTTLETLFEIIKEGKVYESSFEMSKEQYNELLKIVTKAPPDRVTDWLKKRRKVKKDIWKDIFVHYFETTQNSQQIITDFILNRNHIAHNKPISYSAYQIMKESFESFDEMVKLANAKFEESAPSEEHELTKEVLEEQANEQAYEEYKRQEYEKNYLRDRIYEETGIEIRWEYEILELLTEKCEEIYQSVYEKYYWDNMYSIASMKKPKDDEDWEVMFSITCNACPEARLEVHARFDINDEMDSDSYLYLQIIAYDEDGIIQEDNEGCCSFVIHYHNGCGSENHDEGTIDPYSDTYLDDSDELRFMDVLTEKVETLNPYIAFKESLEILAVKEGAANPVAEFPCIKCEEYGVSILDDFYKFGHCCYCGTDNEVSVCERCGTPFGVDGGVGELCDACIEYIENE